MPDLRTLTDGRTRLSYSTKETAAAIRVALKTAFPRQTFSVRTEYGSLYSATRITWTDGPTEPEVHAVTNRFSSKTFDGRDDSTHYHSQIVDGQEVSYSGWINLHRDISDTLRARAERIARFIGEDNVHAVTHTLRGDGLRVRLK